MTNVVLAKKRLSTMPGADEALHFWTLRFENDVKTYGTQTLTYTHMSDNVFENDVKTYGTQTFSLCRYDKALFENDVKTYGTQTFNCPSTRIDSLRMM